LLKQQIGIDKEKVIFIHNEAKVRLNTKKYECAARHLGKCEQGRLSYSKQKLK
jgi:hypothetical protein